MRFEEFLKSVSKIKNIPLPAEVSHFKMVPPFRQELLKKQKEAIKKAKHAGVLSLFYPDEDMETKFVLILRKTYKGVHSAQVAFPGGKLEAQDASLRDTALRETFEEVGVLESSINVIRELTDVYIPPSNFLVTPFIGFVDKRPVFDLNYEVDKVIEVLVSDLLNDSNITSIKMSTSYMDNVNIPCFKLNDYIVWGATAMILSEIKELLK